MATPPTTTTTPATVPVVDNLQAVINAVRDGQPASTVFENDRVKIVYTPRSKGGLGEIHTFDLTAYLEKPPRKRGTVTVFDADSFTRVLMDNAQAGDAAIYVSPDPDSPEIVGVMNGNGPNGSGWGDFRVRIDFRKTVQWKKWMAIDGKMLPQTSFAEFIEENLGDIQTPDGALVMEIVSQLQATRTVGFKAQVRLQSGAYTFQHDENVDATVGAGQIAVPDTFTLALSPFFGVQPFAIPARFRYRLEDRKLSLGLKLQRVEDVIARVVNETIAELTPPEGVPILNGAAPSATVA